MTVASQRASDGEAVGGAVAGTLTRRDVAEVAELIGGYVRRTPVVTVDLADFGLAPGPLTLKLEQLQHSGSFKARGAFTNLLRREIPAAGVAAASGGNHGAAVAYAAGVLGMPARIFVPEVSSPAKISRIRGYGADLVVEGATYSDSFAISQRWIADRGALAVHAYDHPQTIQGAGTTGLEFGQQAPEVTTVLAAVGGGGLLSGICLACSGTSRVVGAE
ncbi:MAG: pyridoxal-phosphate dependent enzyme, partial [Streptosporangiaceae bacterium]